MCRTLNVAGVTMANWPGVMVLKSDGHGGFVQDDEWNWSREIHWHYEVASFDEGSYWVPASSHPPRWWDKVLIEGDAPTSGTKVNPKGTEYRPNGVFIWIPALPPQVGPGKTDNKVKCDPPKSAPVVTASAPGGDGVASGNGLAAAGNGAAGPVSPTPPVSPTGGGIEFARQRLNTILAQPTVLAADTGGSAFQDSDGLISFVNLSSDLVNHSPAYKTGTAVFDKIANFISTLRIKTFAAMQKGIIQPLQGDTPPATQWDASVTHVMQHLLQESGGLTDYSITQETYSDTQVLAEFSTSFIKLFFDAVTVPSSIISGISTFISGVGKSLQLGWDNRQRDYQVALLGQCHEAVQENSDGAPVYRYFPKLKYYFLRVSSSQTEFTSDCATVRKITFNFQYEYYVTAVAAAVLDTTTADYKSFTDFLNTAQTANYTDAKDKLNAILNGTVSDGPSHQLSTFNVDLGAYPSMQATPSRRLVPA
ncbi:hypothetical protein SAMN05192558_101660 [Actinokineospora alba]|uniref:Virulence factor Evf domain-containing protein n=1 Tax=Actinokineospora alba TaxID=504798 RepID=A0A1H0G4U6_9PSEU|nr:hypothetical protein [Actinokineospora alba]TDP69761.1 hypothetical protein C8E96_5355 [Actinokineospora alba]SDI09317.1 hypothetical protein SAMN05421871_103211 [Actinokineospora alba]SDO01860.1 hypothetical protein SAMN05192558_101660 [Actinokineospora alba]